MWGAPWYAVYRYLCKPMYNKSLAAVVALTLPEYTRGDFAAVDAARKAHGFPDETAPAATLLGIQSLFANGALLEIEGVAVVDP